MAQLRWEHNSIVDHSNNTNGIDVQFRKDETIQVLLRKMNSIRQNFTEMMGKMKRMIEKKRRQHPHRHRLMRRGEVTKEVRKNTNEITEA